MNRCPHLAIKGIDNLNVNELDDTHALFSAEAQECDAELRECDGNAQECEFAQRGKGTKGMWGLLHPNHLYIDTCASYASTPHRYLLKDIKEANRGLVGHSNCGSTTMTEVGDLGNIKGMWLNKSGIANIVPLELISKLWWITYDSHRGMNRGHFVVHTDHGNIVVKKNYKGMPYIHLVGVDGEVALDFVHTVRGNPYGAGGAGYGGASK